MSSNFGFGKCSAHIKSSVDLFQTKFPTKVRFFLDFWQDLSSSSLLPKKLAFIGRPANQRPVFMQETAWTHVLTQNSEKTDFSTLGRGGNEYSMTEFIKMLLTICT